MNDKARRGRMGGAGRFGCERTADALESGPLRAVHLTHHKWPTPRLTGSYPWRGTGGGEACARAIWGFHDVGGSRFGVHGSGFRIEGFHTVEYAGFTPPQFQDGA